MRTCSPPFTAASSCCSAVSAAAAAATVPATATASSSTLVVHSPSVGRSSAPGGGHVGFSHKFDMQIGKRF
uniref:Putative secreted protein n=1 Tax=Anopheles marajoara TaxID=58244 RepID=A0A2M4CEC7_9DIPT